MKSIFAQRLKETRIANHLTQEKLAARLDYGYTAIANYESGRNEPSISDFVRLCEALNASADYLLGLSDIRRPCRGGPAAAGGFDGTRPCPRNALRRSAETLNVCPIRTGFCPPLFFWNP